MYIKLINGIPENYTIGQLRRDNPQTSFPKNISDNILEQYDMYPVNVLPRPEINMDTHYLKQSAFYQVDGNWQVHYYAEPLPEIQASEAIRNTRDQLLTESDWIVAKSYEVQNPVPQDCIDYRQALRDIPEQEGFPYDVVWPAKPMSLARQTSVIS
jgi:hypothetical protein